MMWETPSPGLTGAVEEIRQLPIKPSSYQKTLDEEENHPSLALKDGDSISSAQPVTWGFAEGPFSWESGRSTFGSLNEETGLMEESFRLFAEECDCLQGFQTSFDAQAFGAFTLSLIEHIRDDYPMKSILAIPLLNASCRSVKISGAFSAVNDALVFRDLLASSALTVPLAQPSAWGSSSAALSKYIEFDSSCLYETSAIVSAHVETVTLPLRHRTGSQDIVGLAATLNWRNDCSIVGLEGESTSSFTVRYDPTSFSPIEASGAITAQSTVIRCDDPQRVDDIIESVKSKSSEAKLNPYLHYTLTYPSYPLPSSYPKFFKKSKGLEKALVYSSLVSRPSSTAATFQASATFIRNFLRRGDMGHECWNGLEEDDLKELVEDMTRISDSIAIDQGMEENGDSGNEEYEVDL
ncbi:mtDNA inheritance, partitioning of the mitochondrial organelle [Tulasnella sp. 427]|nr:mtDNA inheritance, partitioning of the mitochondrial organelle [Tulasnella sp. 427]